MAGRQVRERRSLSMTRAPGRIEADGDRETAEILMRALRAPTTDHEAATEYTHPFNTFPARMHPATARVLVELVGEGAPRTAPIVDPFCGSGTVLVEARAAGRRAVGIDLNPLATLIARAKTWTQTARRRSQLREAGHAIAGNALAAGKAARRSGGEATGTRKPKGFDPNARDRKLLSWFQPHVRRELEFMAAAIEELRERDTQIGEVLLACLSSILYKVSSRASDTDDTWIERTIGRGLPARLFAKRVDLLVAGLDELSGTPGAPPEVFERDARTLGEVVAPGTAAGIVTSPPYAGTYDYADHQKLRFDFLALRHRVLDAGEIGSRRSFEAGEQPHTTWLGQFGEVIAAIARALRPGREAALVIGDSVARGRAIYALDDLREVLGDELVVLAWASQHRPMHGPVERNAFGDRPKAEHIVVLRRTAE